MVSEFVLFQRWRLQLGEACVRLDIDSVRRCLGNCERTAFGHLFPAAIRDQHPFSVNRYAEIGPGRVHAPLLWTLLAHLPQLHAQDDIDTHQMQERSKVQAEILRLLLENKADATEDISLRQHLQWLPSLPQHRTDVVSEYLIDAALRYKLGIHDDCVVSRTMVNFLEVSVRVLCVAYITLLLYRAQLAQS